MKLSPHGEGYCPVCRFIVGLGRRGLLDPHTRMSEYDGRQHECPGGLTKPPKRTPYSSRKSAFTFTSPRAVCPVCGKRVAQRTHDLIAKHPGGRPYLAVHDGHFRSVCPGSGAMVPRNHDSERG